MLRWVVVSLLAAVAACDAEAPRELLSGDLFLVPPGPLDMRVLPVGPSGWQLHAISWHNQPVGRAAQSQGLWMAFGAMDDLAADGGRPGQDWLPERVAWREALSPHWTARAGADLLIRAARRLWPDFGGPVSARIAREQAAPGELETVVYELSAQPAPGVELRTYGQLWPWGRRVASLSRSQPLVPAGWKPRTSRDEALRIARREAAASTPKAARGAALALVGTDGGASLTEAPRWYVMLSDAADPVAGLRAGAQTALVKIDALNGKVQALPDPGPMRALAAAARVWLSRAAPEAEALAPSVREPRWSPDGIVFTARHPSAAYPWWRPTDDVVYVVRDGQAQWLRHALGRAARYAGAALADGKVLLISDDGLHVCSQRDGATVTVPNVRAADMVGSATIACATRDRPRAGYVVEVRDLADPGRVVRCLAQHNHRPMGLRGDPRGRWLAYAVDERLVLADLTQGQPDRHVAFAADTRVEPVAWIADGPNSRCLMTETANGVRRCWLVDPADGGQQAVALPAPLREPGATLHGAAPGGGILALTNRGLYAWSVTTRQLAPIALPAWREAGPMVFRPGLDTMDVALAQLDAAYQRLRGAQP